MTNSIRRLRRAAASLAFGCIALATASASAAEPLRGKLLIIGGNIGSNGPTLYKLLADAIPDGATIGVIPTASGDAPGSMKSAADKIRESAGARTVKGVLISKDDASRADDAGLAAQIDACTGLFFTGGQQDRILEVFKPGGRETAISKAVDRLLARGGIVAGSSAGAAIMCDPMIMGGDSADALAAAKSPPLPMGQGLGYFPYGVVDQHFLQRGRFGRLIVALELTKQNFGYGISESRALLVDRATNELRAIGRDAIVMIDRREATTDETGGRHGLRISLLSNGDKIDGVGGAITPSDRRQPVVIGDRSGEPEPVTDAWGKNAIGELIHNLAKGTSRSAMAHDDKFELRFTVDERTRILRADGESNDETVTNLRLDIVRRK